MRQVGCEDGRSDWLLPTRAAVHSHAVVVLLYGDYAGPGAGSFDVGRAVRTAREFRDDDYLWVFCRNLHHDGAVHAQLRPAGALAADHQLTTKCDEFAVEAEHVGMIRSQVPREL